MTVKSEKKKRDYPRPITRKQRAFIDEYLKDMNAAAAAVRAGYKPGYAWETGYNLLSKSQVRSEVDRLLEERSKRAGLEADQVIRELVNIAFADPRDVMSWDDRIITAKDSSKLTKEQAATIAEVVCVGGRVRIKLHDKVAALDKLCKHLGIYAAEKRILENPDGSGLFQSLSKEHRDAIVAAATKGKD